MKVTKKVAGVEYAIRDIVVVAKKLEQKGKKIDSIITRVRIDCGFEINKFENFFIIVIADIFNQL